MVINQQKTTLSGTVINEDGEFPLTGTIIDDQVTVVWTVPEDGKLMDITMKGKLDRQRDHRHREAGERRRGLADRPPRRGGRSASTLRFVFPRQHASVDLQGADIMTRLRYALLALALSIAPTAFAQETAPRPNIAGDWDVTVQSPQGTNTVLVTLKQDGEKIEGLFKSPLGELPFTGTLVGNEMKFAFSFPVDGQPLLITMTGKVDGDAVTGKADFGGFAEGDWSAKRAQPSSRGGNHHHAGDDDRRDHHRRPHVYEHGALNDDGRPRLRRKVGRRGEDAWRRLPGHRHTSPTRAGKLSGTFGSQMGEVPVTGTVEGKSMKLTMVAQTPQRQHDRHPHRRSRRRLDRQRQGRHRRHGTDGMDRQAHQAVAQPH